jgi:hypothetical protein
MKTNLFPLLLSLLLLVPACKSARNVSTREMKNIHHFGTLRNEPPVTTSFYDADTSFAFAEDFQNNENPASLFDLPRTAAGDYIITPGFYEGEFESFCLHPGTHGPSSGDGYLYAPLKGSRKDIIETILQRSETAGNISQRNVQLLIWALLTKATFRDLSPNLKQAATELLTPKQLYELNGGALGLIPELATAMNVQMPASLRTALAIETQLLQLFRNSSTSYEEFERLAVLEEPSPVDRPEFKRGRWSRHPSGYYIRFFPKGYQRTTIQVYLPADSSMATGSEAIVRSVLFQPSNIVAMPANSKAQRIGIGGPWGISKPRNIFKYPLPQFPKPIPLPKPRKTKTPVPPSTPASKDEKTKT